MAFRGLVWILLAAPGAVAATVPTAREALAHVPLAFEENAGQTDAEVKFLARGPGYAAFFTSARVVLVRQRPGSRRTRTLGLRFVGRAGLPPKGEQAEAGASHYFRGEDPRKWRTGVKRYGRVVYPNAFPGVDAVFYGNHRMIEYDLIVAPGRDPDVIRFTLEGASRLRVTASGDLSAAVGEEEFRLARPVAYQETSSGREPVAAQFRLLGRGEFAFALGDYDRSRPLVIDPVVYLTYLGGTELDMATAVTVDVAGSIYVAGHTLSPDFPRSAPPYKSQLAAGDSDAFVTKLNAQATAVIYSTFLGGRWQDAARAIAVDTSGSVYVTGDTVGNFPTTSSAYKPTIASSPAPFIAKLSVSGAALEYSTYLDGAGSGRGIAVDAARNVYVTGFTYTAAFTTTAGAFQTKYNGNTDAFVVKLNSTGSAALYATFLGGRGEDQAHALRVDSFGIAHIAGYTTSTDYPVKAGSYRVAHSGGADAFVTRLAVDGSALWFSTYLGGSDDDRAQALTLDADGNVYVAGQTSSANFPVTAGAAQPSFGGGAADGFIAKLNQQGSALAYSTYLGGPGSCTVRDPFRTYACDGVMGIALGTNNTIWATGVAGPGFPVVSGASQPTALGNGDAFIAQLNAAGSSLMSSSFVGGSGADAGLAIAPSPDRTTAVFVGFTSSSDLPTVTGSYQRQARGYTDAFIGRVPGCIITLPTYESFFPATSGGYLLDVYASSESCFWTPVSDSPWVEIQFFTGTGTGQVSYAVQANTGGARTANITIGSAVFKVKQVSGACLYLGGTGSWFGSGGGSFTLDVFGSCPWTATSNVAWVTIQSGSGTGNGQVHFTVEPHGSPGARTGKIDVSGVIYEVNQVGAPAGLAACDTSVFPLLQTYPASGGNASISVTAPAGCQWTASSPVSWVTLTEGAQRSGNGAVSFQVQANPLGYARFAQLRVGGQTFTVVQQGQ